MITVYALHDSPSGMIYVGMTKDLTKRVREHRRGKSFFTKRFQNFKVVYTEECRDYREGRTREKYLKSGIGKEFLKNLIKKDAGLV